MSRIQVTDADHRRLRTLIDSWTGGRDQGAAQALANELDRAEVVPADAIAGNMVTMNSRVVSRMWRRERGAKSYWYILRRATWSTRESQFLPRWEARSSDFQLGRPSIGRCRADRSSDCASSTFSTSPRKPGTFTGEIATG
jgi:hypothetical protein